MMTPTTRWWNAGRRVIPTQRKPRGVVPDKGGGREGMSGMWVARFASASASASSRIVTSAHRDNAALRTMPPSVPIVSVAPAVRLKSGSLFAASSATATTTAAAAAAAAAAATLLAVGVRVGSSFLADEEDPDELEAAAPPPPRRGFFAFSSSSSSTTSLVDGTVNRALLEGRAALVDTRGVAESAPSPPPPPSAPSAAAAAEEEEEVDASPHHRTTTTTLLLNWSGTHAVHVPNDRLWEPDTVEQVEAIVRECHRNSQPVRPMGSALSPNAFAFHSGGMVSLAHLDHIVKVDAENQLVTVQAGARVSQVVEALRPYQLTLPNLASIAEQQMGGFVSVGAHGTGAAIAPVDHYVTELTLVTPGLGTVTLSEDKDGDIFHMAKVGLGCLGVVVQLTVRCVPAHRLVEHTVVMTRQEAIDQLNSLLSTHKHVRYMWIPYADAVVVVTNHPEHDDTQPGGSLPNFSSSPSSSLASQEERLRPLTDLLLQMSKERASSSRDAAEEGMGGGSGDSLDSASKSESADFPPVHTPESLVGMGFGELRDALLALDPLDVDHVRRVNQAEAEFWRRSQGIQVKPSDQLLQFDCGGQQWVWEVCFPTGTRHENNGNDVQFMQKLLAAIEENGIPAPAPIEQRWSASSSSLMSPAHGDNLNGLHCWVGIINYLPSQDERQRRDITDLFRDRYCELMRVVGQPYNAASHWAKLERPNSVYKLVDLQLSLADRFPLHKFNQLRQVYDPRNILSSPHVDLLLGKPPGT